MEEGASCENTESLEDLTLPRPASNANLLDKEYLLQYWLAFFSLLIYIS